MFREFNELVDETLNFFGFWERRIAFSYAGYWADYWDNLIDRVHVGRVYDAFNDYVKSIFDIVIHSPGRISLNRKGIENSC
jgi:hypothetical protein